MRHGLRICLYLTLLLTGMSVSQAATQVVGSQPSLMPTPASATPDPLGDYQNQIEALEHQRGEYDYRLIEPLLSLARQQLEAGEHNAAQASIDRAQHLYHRNEGVMTPNQISAVDLKIQLHVQQQQIELADQQQHLAYHLLQQNNPGNPTLLGPQHLLAIHRLVDWYKETGQYKKARKLLQDTIEAQETAPTVDPATLANNLAKLATITRLNRNCCSHELLERAVEVVEMAPEPSRLQLAELYTQLADAYLITNKREAASAYYQRAWQATNDAQRAEFGQPEPLIQAQALETRAGQSETWVRNSNRNRHENGLFIGSASQLGPFRKITPRERFYIDTMPPQAFAVTHNTHNYPVTLQGYDEPGTDNASHRVIGEPYQFNQTQLMQILPGRFKNAEEMAKLVVQMEFSVDEQGKPGDITIISDIPARLSRTLRKAVARSTFRPRLVDGQPAATAKVKLTQTFRTSG